VRKTKFCLYTIKLDFGEFLNDNFLVILHCEYMTIFQQMLAERYHSHRTAFYCALEFMAAVLKMYRRRRAVNCFVTEGTPIRVQTAILKQTSSSVTIQVDGSHQRSFQVVSVCNIQLVIHLLT